MALGDFEAPARTGEVLALGSGSVDAIDRIVKSGKPLPLARQAVLDEFQRRYRVRYPAWSEILFVLHALGYRKVRSEDGLTTETRRRGEDEGRIDR